MPWWGVISSAGSPVLLVGGWTAAALAQPRSYNPVADTISAVAEAFDLTRAEIVRLVRNGLQAAFLPAVVRDGYLAEIGRLV